MNTISSITLTSIDTGYLVDWIRLDENDDPHIASIFASEIWGCWLTWLIPCTWTAEPLGRSCVFTRPEEEPIPIRI